MGAEKAVMLEVVRLVDRLVPGLLKSGRPSVACVCTTRPKYLVFDRDAARPACVVEFGPAERLRRTRQALAELHARLPGRVARPLCLHPSWPDGSAVLIQEGLPGAPWFRVADGLVTAADWQRVFQRAVAAMRDLHAAIRSVPTWSSEVQLGDELARQVRLLENADTRVLHRLRDRANQWGKPLERLGPLRRGWQHGDYSLNNLLVSPDSIAVIDLAEVGETVVPLHDAFGLALSMELSQPGSLLARSECIRLALEPSMKDASLAREHLPGLLMHHLVWRINQCRGMARRAALRRMLTRWLDELTMDPSILLGEW